MSKDKEKCRFARKKSPSGKRALINSFHCHMGRKARLVNVCGWLAGRRQVTVNAKGVVFIPDLPCGVPGERTRVRRAR